MFLCACAAAGSRLKVVIWKAIGGNLYMGLVGGKAELANVIVKFTGVVVVYSFNLFCGVTQ